MIHDNYRTSSVWKKARHLVLALSLTADSLLAREKGLSRDIRRHSIFLLIRIDMRAFPRYGPVNR